jgi:hypothetical protein
MSGGRHDLEDPFEERHPRRGAVAADLEESLVVRPRDATENDDVVARGVQLAFGELGLMLGG